MDKEAGKVLNKRVHTLAMQLHARDDYTDVVACDGSKKDDHTQPWDTTYKTGPTAYGHYGGPVIQTLSKWEKRFQTEIPTEEEIIKAIKQSSRGNRIGDEADTMQAELAAILTYLQYVAAQADARDRRVLIMSDCYTALRAIEDTWRGRGVPY